MTDPPGDRSPLATTHEFLEFRRCSFGDGRFYNGDYAHRARCRCGWLSAASTDQKALVALYELHAKGLNGSQ